MLGVANVEAEAPLKQADGDGGAAHGARSWPRAGGGCGAVADEAVRRDVEGPPARQGAQRDEARDIRAAGRLFPRRRDFRLCRFTKYHANGSESASARTARRSVSCA
ncbi:hypothetical protein mvi_27050 [Methylobacterium indicum]|uniref:Uncharacterized protein n=1 Tax=Methylobacterium indicum TaxID=1775910 RepID=A0A8H8WTU4_9HYPH|nr:hypothetical protein mvi_27050 [Methylobacterium indicum]